MDASLLPVLHDNRSWNTKWNKKYLGLFLICLLVLFLIIIIAVTSPNIRNHKGNVYLSERLPKSFSVNFEIHKQETSTWEKQNETIAVEIHDTDLRYREVSLIGIGGSVKLSTTALNNISFISSDIGNTYKEHSCHDVDSIHFIPVLRAMQNATKVTFYPQQYLACPDLWSSSQSSEMVIYYCLRNGQLSSITQGGIQAKVVSWKSPATELIRKPKSLSCSPKPNVMSNVARKPFTARKSIDRSKLKKKKCLFIHGAGEKPKKPEILHNTFPDYWGEIHKYTPRCTSRTFLHFDTVTRGWDDLETLKFVCNAVLEKNGKKMISNYIIVTHSMGNLILAAAFYKQFCFLDIRNSEWYSVQAPWKGSHIANGLVRLCKHKIAIGILSKIGKVVNFNVDHYCDNGYPSVGYLSLETDYKSKTGMNFNHLIEIGKQFTNGALCGTNAYGVGVDKVESVGLLVISKFFNLERPNDGLVSYESCDIYGDMYDTYLSSFYTGHINHSEGRCKHGKKHIDWSIGDVSNPDRKPCSWYEHL